MPLGETTEDHKKFQQDEANAIERDKARGASAGRGLFGGRFRHSTPRRIPVIRDDEDGVERCPQCTWEIQDGWCESCGYMVEEDWSDTGLGYSDDLSDLDDDILVERALEERDMYGLPDDYIDDDVFVGHIPAGGRGSLSPYDDHRAEALERNPRARAQRALERAEARRADRRMPMATPHPIYSDEPAGHHSAYSDEGMEDEDADSDTEQYDSEADYAGSLDDFIDNDADGRPLSLTASTVSHYDTDNDTERGTGNDTDGSDARFSPLHVDNHTGGREPYGAEQDESEEEIDQGRVHSHQHRRRYRRVISDDENSSNGSHRVATHDSYRTARTHRSRHGGNSQDAESNGGTSQRAPIEIASDSEPMPMPRRRRRRAVVDDETSNDDGTPTQSHYSQSSGTLRQQSPTLGLPADSTRQSQSGRLRPSSPILIGSSPVRTTSVTGWADANNDTGSSPFTDNPDHPHRPGHLSGDRVQQAVQNSSERSASSSDEGVPRLELPSIAEPRRPPPSHHQNRLAVPRSPSYRSSSRRSHTPMSAGSRSSANGTNLDTLRRLAPVEERAAYKTERRLAKQERRRRDRAQANVVSEGSHLSDLEAWAHRNEAFGRRWN